ncbi:hypothetical protein QH494_07695 [Sphingomonas sp. AR_OL41]|uniref:hypothetical protein n=1 Tax=Sphingomonas sp. AR_OL41 TaxID=3042729 RepID=UPI00247FC30A|nr:hypothetical protein [Sphingomonas sp. AR_OL41]MDH7972067.1 hypothetical protein [Sphingomonas sp. AR_OL41]
MRSTSLSALLALALTSCAPAIVRDHGWIERPVAQDRSFVLGALPGGADPQARQARDAVRAALVAQGYREADDGRYRVDIGFGQFAGTASPLAGKTAPATGAIILCRRQSHRLSVAMIKRSDGTVVYRGAASLARCGTAPAGMIASLAEAAIGSD